MTPWVYPASVLHGMGLWGICRGFGFILKLLETDPRLHKRPVVLTAFIMLLLSLLQLRSLMNASRWFCEHPVTENLPDEVLFWDYLFSTIGGELAFCCCSILVPRSIVSFLMTSSAVVIHILSVIAIYLGYICFRSGALFDRHPLFRYFAIVNAGTVLVSGFMNLSAAIIFFLALIQRDIRAKVFKEIIFLHGPRYVAIICLNLFAIGVLVQSSLSGKQGVVQLVMYQMFPFLIATHLVAFLEDTYVTSKFILIKNQAAIEGMSSNHGRVVD
ncbi:hypothetical protein EDD86DRAFT_243711 [Gorgonomyces haynaldii]|nr:hypothetical protein EDD86DRAFT_243711 [Gorgonomyces haynaldii]